MSKKDRRSARTRKREEADATIIATMNESFTNLREKVIKQSQDNQLLRIHEILTIDSRFQFSNVKKFHMPSYPRSKSSCAPMVPEVTQ